MTRLLAELGLGVRMAFAGGRRGWAGTALAALGVALGAAALLLAASAPVILHERAARNSARADLPLGRPNPPVGRTVADTAVESDWDGSTIRGRLIWPDSPDAPLPPGLPDFPGEHRMYVSPALREALAGPGGDDLRRQMPYEVAGTIAPSGLSGPHELAYYAGYRRVETLVGDGGAWRIATWGAQPDPVAGPGRYAVLVALLVTLLLPVAILVGAALRFGADTRDRRLAAIRLVGADKRTVLRIAAAESLVPATLGLLLGTVFFLIARASAGQFALQDVSVYPSDVRPVPLLAAGVVVAVVVLSAAMTLLGFRGVAVEPLGVFRRTVTRRRRIWWRLLLPVAAVLLLLPAAIDPMRANESVAATGLVVLVAGMIPLLPYLVPLAARVLPGGPASWQLASGQLRRDPAAATRAVTGIVVAVTGAVALHVFFAAATHASATSGDPADAAFSADTVGRVTADGMRRQTALFEQVDGVRAGTVARQFLYSDATDGYSIGYLFVGDCAALRQIATVGTCADGDVFVDGDVGRSVTLSVDTGGDPARGATVPVPRPAGTVALVGSDAQNVARAVLMTPSALPAARYHDDQWMVETRMFLTAVPEDRRASAGARLRGVAVEIDPVMPFWGSTPVADPWAAQRTALTIGSAILLLILGLGLLLDVGERLHDRRRLLGVLAAVGARRSTVAWSVLLQAVVPVLAGLALATGAGAGLGAVLMRLGQIPVRYDAAAVLTPVATGGVLVLATAAAVLLPAVRRVTRTEQIRHE